MARRLKRLRRSNGAGSVGISNRKDLRKPFYVRVTTGHELQDDGTLRQKRKLLGYYETEAEAEIALANFLENAGGATDSAGLKTPIQDIWTDFVKEQRGKVCSDSRSKQYDYTWLHIPDRIKNANFEVVNYKIWADVFDELRDEIKLGYPTIKKIRTDMSMMYEYANKRGINIKNFPKMYSLGDNPNQGKNLVFNIEEIKHLWDMYNSKVGNAEAQFTVKVVLMLMYNGCRINEFLGLKTKDVHLSERYISIVDAKTPAGIRKIPIHKCVYPIYQELYNEHHEYFLSNPKKNNGKYSYENFRDSYWDRLRDNLGWNEKITPHACRKTFSSYMKFYNVEHTCQKLMLGHEGALDTQEKYYTVVPLKKLYAEINKIPYADKLDELCDV